MFQNNNKYLSLAILVQIALLFVACGVCEPEVIVVEVVVTQIVERIVTATPVPNNLDLISPSSQEPPPLVTEMHLEQVRLLQEQIANEQIDRDQAEIKLTELTAEVGKDGLAWIIRRVPIYDSENENWINFEDYLDELFQDGDINPNSNFAKDPVGTGVDLFFGDYSPEDLLDMFGFTE